MSKFSFVQRTEKGFIQLRLLCKLKPCCHLLFREKRLVPHLFSLFVIVLIVLKKFKIKHAKWDVALGFSSVHFCQSLISIYFWFHVQFQSLVVNFYCFVCPFVLKRKMLLIHELNFIITVAIAPPQENVFLGFRVSFHFTVSTLAWDWPHFFFFIFNQLVL